ncbi:MULTISPECIES: hypothetical protein [Actinomadura]|uniref:Secreted protein n=1 Tax=Actinomadura yumaensis TaxID=111807 RepID=A0ABW2CRI5_9ACTN|nr:hypothetical protein [Actinomadura sp. J1-007]MWK36741.1 hypothetical protein [Actinomadura sp. J1-007]
MPLYLMFVVAVFALGSASLYYYRTRSGRSDRGEVFDGFSTRGRTPARKNPDNPDDPDPYGDIESFRH